MPHRGKFIGGQDNLYVPDAPTVGTATPGYNSGSIAFTAPSDVGNSDVTSYGVRVFSTDNTINYKVTVASGTLSTGGSGNIYFIDGNPTKSLLLVKGFTYIFDLSDSSNSGHPFAFKNSSGSSYTTGVTNSGTVGNASATVTLVLATDASEPSSYYCTSHGNGMGNVITIIEASKSIDPLGDAEVVATGSSSPLSVTGLTNRTSYSAQIWAINGYGNSPLSFASNSFIPSLSRAYIIGADRVRIDYITITTTGNALDFGDLTTSAGQSAAAGSDIRGINYPGHNTSTYVDVIDYITLATTGNATDFGNLNATKMSVGATSNNVRGINFGGQGNTYRNQIEYINIATTGNVIDFGNLSALRKGVGGSASSTRAILSGGLNGAGSTVNVIEYITIASAGDATDFGDLSTARNTGGLASSTRAVFGGGRNDSNAAYNIMDYVTISTTGNASDFGDLSVARNSPGGTATGTRGVFAGGLSTNVIDYITIASTGNATDFGDLHKTGTEGMGAHCSEDPAVQNEIGFVYFAPAAMGLFAGGIVESSIEYVNIATDGEGAMFGDLQEKTYGSYGSSCSTTRACFFGGLGHVNDPITTVQFITFSTKGKATTFGNLSVNKYQTAATSNVTRGLNAGGYDNKNEIEYITIASEGNATDFGDLTTGREKLGALSSTTRSVFTGGYTSSNQNVLDYITIASTGNATDFGDQTSARRNAQGASSNTRGLLMGGDESGGAVNTVGYITIASVGNATDFGDLSAVSKEGSAVSNKTLALYHLDSDKIRLDKFTIASTGNATDWGDISKISIREFSGSNSHGGIA